MTIDVQAASVITNAALAGGYVVVAIVYVLAQWYRRLPRTTNIRWYLVALLTLCVSRAIYFGVPNSVWDLTEEPDPDIPRYTRAWWSNLAQFGLYVISNTALALEGVAVLRLWDQALCVVNQTESVMDKALVWCFAVYALWQAWTIAANFVLSTGVALVMTSLSHTVVSLTLLCLFVWFWFRLWHAMTFLTQQRTPWQTLWHSLTSCFPCCASRFDRRLGLPLNDTAHYANMASARAKLTRLTHLATGYTLSLAFKAAVLIYQAVLSSTGQGFDKTTWWVVILLDFTLTELVLSLAVLRILWKKPSGSSSKGSGGVASPPASLQRLRNAHVASSGSFGGHPHAEVAELRRGYPSDGSGMGGASAMPHGMGMGMGVGDPYYAGGAAHGDGGSSASGGYGYEGAYAYAPVADVAANWGAR